jgi:hypothetical protein
MGNRRHVREYVSRSISFGFMQQHSAVAVGDRLVQHVGGKDMAIGPVHLLRDKITRLKEQRLYRKHLFNSYNSSPSSDIHFFHLI